MKMDLTGEVYERLTVVSEAPTKVYKSGNRQRRWNVVCECGRKRVVYQFNLRGRHTKSCGCLQKEHATTTGKNNLVDITGKKFGRLTAIKDTKKREDRSLVWLCECECGNYKEVSHRDLAKRNTTSCGCLAKEIIVARNKHWGMEGKFVGEKHPRWNPELSQEEREKDRSAFKEPLNNWRNKVFARDSYLCIICGCQSQEINAHHLDGWNWCKKKRFDIDNGVTLCKECHINFHKNYGYGDNTKEQFNKHLKQLGIQGDYSKKG